MEYINKAYVCGAYVGPFENIKERLEKIGIQVIGHCDKARSFQVPKAASLIVLITDQVSHDISQKARDAADELDIPIVAGNYKNWTNLESRIFARELGVRGFQGPELKASIGEMVKAKLEPVKPTNLVRSEESTVSPKTAPSQKTEKIKAALIQVFEAHKQELETYTNIEAAEEASAILGFRITPNTATNYRNALKYKQTPKGFKKKKRGVEHTPTPKTPPAQPAASGNPTEAESEMDTIQSMLNEWVAKWTVSKLYLAYDNGIWDANWEQIAVVQRTKRYGGIK